MRNGPRIRRQRGQVLIILFLGTLLFGGSAAGLGWLYGGNNYEQLRKQLKKQVAEPERRKSLGRILERLQSSAEGHSESHERQVRQLLAILERHDGSRAEVDGKLAEMDALNLFARQTLLDLRYELRAAASAEEWTGLFPPPAPIQGPPLSPAGR
jgi:hypothetical protein